MAHKHGYSKEPWYVTYRGMMNRCYRKKAGNYKYYGKQGIGVCGEWHNIENFKKWVAESNYEEGLTLDRLDPCGDYCPENCRWATRKEQCNNRKNTVFLEYEGKRHTISEWADIKGINRSTLNNRVCRGWDVEKALGSRNYYALGRKSYYASLD
jgi:hypothetical protein